MRKTRREPEWQNMQTEREVSSAVDRDGERREGLAHLSRIRTQHPARILADVLTTQESFNYDLKDRTAVSEANASTTALSPRWSMASPYVGNAMPPSQFDDLARLALSYENI
ncbi:MAG: hypothetical protein Q4B69_03090, partial [Slackia sp.]|nr:hypothetical protein [Slackia sp.]